MIALAAPRKPAHRSQPKPPDDRVRVPGKSGSHGTPFGAHQWLERYRASHDGAGDSSDLLAGVPFN